MLSIPVRIRSNGLIGILVSVQLMPVAGPPQLGLDAKGTLVQKGQQQTGVQAFGVIALRDGFAVGPLGDMQPLDPTEVQQAINEAQGEPLDSVVPDSSPDSRSRGTGDYAPEAERFVTGEQPEEPPPATPDSMA